MSKQEIAPEPPRGKFGCVHVLVMGAGAAVVLGLGAVNTLTNRCVARGTRVLTPTRHRAVEDLRVGDVVLSVDPNSGVYVPATIQAIRTAVRQVTTLCTASLRLTATLDHPLYDPERRTYRELRHWCEGSASMLLTPNSHEKTQVVEEVATRSGHVDVYDISLDGSLHNFVANGVVVHNKKLPPPPPDRCEGLQICYPEGAEPRCPSPAECEVAAKEAYTRAIRLADSADEPGHQHEAYMALDAAGRYLALAELEHAPQGMTDFDARVRELEDELDAIANTHRANQHQLMQRNEYWEAAKNTREWQSSFPGDYSKWAKEASEAELRMRQSGTWPRRFDPPPTKKR